LESLSHSCPTEEWQWLLFVFAAADGMSVLAVWASPMKPAAF